LTVDTAQLLQNFSLTIRKGIRASTDDAKFKNMLVEEQRVPAGMLLDLEDALKAMELAAKERDQEPSKRWQANFDFVYARLLARLAYTNEYNFVLGNKLKKDSPVLKDPKNNTGWLIVPRDTVQEKEAKQYVKKRQKVLEQLIKDHPGTPWDILARQDITTNLGLTIQEAKVD
jgi:hypothetical protein